MILNDGLEGKKGKKLYMVILKEHCAGFTRQNQFMSHREFYSVCENSCLTSSVALEDTEPTRGGMVEKILAWKCVGAGLHFRGKFEVRFWEYVSGIQNKGWEL